EFVALQPVAIVDHVCSVDEDTLKSVVGADEVGGSRRVQQEDIQQLLASVGANFDLNACLDDGIHCYAGGSAANTTKAGLASGWGVRCQLVGARGQDEQGAIFVSSLKRSSVDVSKLRVGKGSTGMQHSQPPINGQRTMRTCLTGAERLSAGDISAEDFGSAKWVFLSGYILYRQDLLQRAVELALSVGAKVALDLASFEVVREFRADVEALLQSGRIECCFCNEDEAAELTGGPEVGSAEKGLAVLAAHCNVAAVTLGERGCLVQQRGGVAFSEPAASNIKVVDATGAGDQFAAGFLYGLMREYPLKKCAQLGCLAGGAIVQVVGAEMTPASWRWL
ncbi:Ribokinase-like protein, partial [Coccomyxa subellipsoidea C-169]